MSARIDQRLPRDVATVHQLGRQFDEDATWQPPELSAGELRLLLALMVAGAVLWALAVVGGVTIWRWLWNGHRAGTEQTLFLLVSFTIAGLVCRWVNVERRR